MGYVLVIMSCDRSYHSFLLSAFVTEHPSEAVSGIDPWVPASLTVFVDVSQSTFSTHALSDIVRMGRLGVRTVVCHALFLLVVTEALGAGFFHWQNTGSSLQVVTTHRMSKAVACITSAHGENSQSSLCCASTPCTGVHELCWPCAAPW